MLRTMADLGIAPLAQQRAGEAAVEALRNAILEGTLTPGQRLREAETAENLGISRTPIRQAFAVLESEGLIEVLPHVGARVRSYDRDDLEELYELRAALEGMAARRACRRADADLLAELRASCKRYENVGFHDDPAAAVEENRRFHDRIISAAGSDRLRHMLDNVTAVPLMYGTALWSTSEHERRSVRAHGEIASAIADGDEDRAERLTREHLLAGRDVVIGHLIAETEASSR